MVKYHVNPETGRPNICRATIKCDFADSNGVEPPHFDNKNDAKKYAEQMLQKEAENKGFGITNTIKKNDKAKKDDAVVVDSDIDNLVSDVDYSQVSTKERGALLSNELENAVQEIVDSGKLQQFLDGIASNGVNRWSANNVLLAAMQLRTYRLKNNLPVGNIFQVIQTMNACGAKQWDKQGRHITSGKGSALYILAPMIQKREVEKDDGSIEEKNVIFGYKGVPVFDVSQTDGEPIKEPVDIVTSIDDTIDEKYIDDMKNMIEKSGYTIVEQETAKDPKLLTGTLGYTSKEKKIVSIDPRLSSGNYASTVAHELSHIMMGHLNDDADDYTKHRGRMETEAEGLAYMLMRRSGLTPEAGKSFSPGYIASWSKGDSKTIKNALNKVTTRFEKLMEEMEWNNNHQEA